MREIHFHLTLIDPPPGVMFALQHGKSDLEGASLSSSGPLTFHFSALYVEGVLGGDADFRGPFVQGPRGKRFVYVNSGTSAGELLSCWTRRAKVPLSGIAHKSLVPGKGQQIVHLEGRIQGRAKDGGPACASVPLLGTGWKRVPGPE